MPLSNLDRALIAIDLLKDGNVTSEAAYATLDKADGNAIQPIVQSGYDQDWPGGVTKPTYPAGDPREGEVKDWADLTANQKAAYFLEATKQAWLAVHKGRKVGEEVPTARQNAESTAATEHSAIFG